MRMRAYPRLLELAALIVQVVKVARECGLVTLSESPCAVIVALGREGREAATMDADKYPHTVAMAERLKDAAVTKVLRRCKAIVEPPSGWIRSVLGLRQCSLRGSDKVRVEWRLVCMALDLRRMA